MKKNLFEYAKKELTQDAVIAWLLDGVGEDFLFNMCPQLEKDIKERNKTIESITVIPQTESIDILVEVKLSCGETFAVIIEDKTDTYLHNFQMLKYIQKIADKNESRKAKYTKVYFLLFKTGDMHHWEVQDYNHWLTVINEQKRTAFDPKTDKDLNQYVKNVLVSSSYTKSKIEFPTKKNKMVPICVEKVYTLDDFKKFLESDSVPKDNPILNYYKDYLSKKGEQKIGTDKNEYCIVQDFADKKGLHFEVVKSDGRGKRNYEYDLLSEKMIIGEEGDEQRFLILPFIAKKEDGDFWFIIHCQLVTKKESIHGYVPWGKLAKGEQQTFIWLKKKVKEKWTDECLKNYGWIPNSNFIKGNSDEIEDESKNNGLQLCKFSGKMSDENLGKLIAIATDIATDIAEFAKNIKI